MRGVFIALTLLTLAAVSPAPTGFAQEPAPRSPRVVPADTSSPTPSLALIDIEPDPALPLKAGERVRMRLTIRYVLELDEAMLDLLVQTAGKPLVTHRESATQGSETRIWKVEFIAPEDPGFDVIVTMHAPGEGLIGVERRTYRVNPN